MAHNTQSTPDLIEHSLLYGTEYTEIALMFYKGTRVKPGSSAYSWMTAQSHVVQSYKIFFARSNPYFILQMYPLKAWRIIGDERGHRRTRIIKNQFSITKDEIQSITPEEMEEKVDGLFIRHAQNIINHRMTRGK